MGTAHRVEDLAVRHFGQLAIKPLAQLRRKHIECHTFPLRIHPRPRCARGRGPRALGRRRRCCRRAAHRCRRSSLVSRSRSGVDLCLLRGRRAQRHEQQPGEQQQLLLTPHPAVAAAGPHGELQPGGPSQRYPRYPVPGAATGRWCVSVRLRTSCIACTQCNRRNSTALT